MGILQKKCRTTGKKALAYSGKGGQNTGTAFPALRLGAVLYLLENGPRCGVPCDTLVCGKIASERRCAISVHSGEEAPERVVVGLGSY